MLDWMCCMVWYLSGFLTFDDVSVGVGIVLFVM